MKASKRVLGIVVAFVLIAAFVLTRILWDFMPFNRQDVGLPVGGIPINDSHERIGVDFGSTERITRSDFAAMITRYVGVAVNPPTQTFVDVNNNMENHMDIMQATAVGVFEAGGLFRPNAYMTRAEVAVAIANAQFAQLLEFSAFDVMPTQFADDAHIDPNARGAIRLLNQLGIMEDISSNMFHPNAEITQGELEQILSTAFPIVITNSIPLSGAIIDGSVVVNAPNATVTDTVIQHNLILGGGVGDGTIRLHNVTLAGDLIIRTGGNSAVEITGNSVIRNVVSETPNVTLSIGQGVLVDSVAVNGGLFAVTSVGNNRPVIRTVEAKGSQSRVFVDESVSVGILNITGDDSMLVLQGSVSSMAVHGKNTTIEVSQDAFVGEVAVTAAGAVINNQGDVLSVGVRVPLLDDILFRSEPTWITAHPELFYAALRTIGYWVDDSAVTFMVIELEENSVLTQFPGVGEPQLNQFRLFVDGELTIFHRHYINGRPQYRLAVEGVPRLTTVQIFQ